MRTIVRIMIINSSSPSSSSAKESKAKQSKAKQSNAEAKQSKVTRARVSHVLPGRPCHMLPPGARVTCYSRALVSHVTQGARVTCYPEPNKAKQSLAKQFK